MAQSLGRLASSSYWDLLSREQLPAPLGATDPGASHYPLPKGLVDCLTFFTNLGCNTTDTPESLKREKVPTLPTLQALFPPQGATTPDNIPAIPAQRVLSQHVQENDLQWKSDNMTKGGSPLDEARVKHIQRYTVKANGGPSSPLYAGTKGDEAQLIHSPLAWLLVVASSPSFDAFPRHHLALFLSLYLGLPIPRSTGVAQLAVHCVCGHPTDPLGHHAATCKQCLGPKATRGHDWVARSIADAITACDQTCKFVPRDVPSHRHSRQKADLYLSELLLGREQRPVVADISICHPVTGTDGEWKDNVMMVRARDKIRKHQGPYAIDTSRAHFAPLIATTYGVLHEDFLRTLWLVADKTREHCHTVGEVREGPAARDYRRNIFTRLRARASVAVARHTAMRLDAQVPLPATAFAHRSYVSSDPNFTGSYANVLTGPPLMPSFFTGG